MAYGSPRLVRTGEGVNIPVQFDGVRAIYQAPRIRVDVLDTHPTATAYGAAENSYQYAHTLSGANATTPNR